MYYMQMRLSNYLELVIGPVDLSFFNLYRSGLGMTRLGQVRLLYSKLGYAAAAPPPELLEILDVAEIRRENKVFFTGLEPDV